MGYLFLSLRIECVSSFLFSPGIKENGFHSNTPHQKSKSNKSIEFEVYKHLKRHCYKRFSIAHNGAARLSRLAGRTKLHNREVIPAFIYS